MKPAPPVKSTTVGRKPSSDGDVVAALLVAGILVPLAEDLCSLAIWVVVIADAAIPRLRSLGNALISRRPVLSLPPVCHYCVGGANVSCARARSRFDFARQFRTNQGCRCL